jgi:DNA-binding response OmpR family regulator
MAVGWARFDDATVDEGDLEWVASDQREESAHQRILVVERDPSQARLLCVGLRSRGWIAESVSDRDSNDGHLLVGDYALVVLDLRPTPDDEMILLRAIASHPGQRFIVISDSSDKEWVIRCFNAGVVDFVGKPFALVELLARVQARLRPSATAASISDHVVRRHGLTIHLTRHTADFGGGPVRLSNREFSLLIYLVENEGRIVGREELLLGAWSLPASSRTNLVESYVRRIREKLGMGIVETVYRKGYTFTGREYRDQ